MIVHAVQTNKDVCLIIGEKN